MKKMNRKGFTIVELVIVIAVIAILAGVLIPTFSGIVNKANQSKSLQEVKNAYTVYVSDTLHANGTPATKIAVAFGEGEGAYWITIEDGKAVIVQGATLPTGFVKYAVDDSGSGDKTLKAAPCANNAHTLPDGAATGTCTICGVVK